MNHNTATKSGGGLAAHGTTVEIKSSHIDMNKALGGSVWKIPESFPTSIAGGGIYGTKAYVLLESVRVVGHSVTSGNGAGLGTFESIIDLRL